MDGKIIRTYDVSDLLQLRYVEVAPDVVVRGVWAKTGISEGSLVEECPVVPIYANEPSSGTNLLRSYAYEWKLKDENGNLVVTHAICMGMGSIYNHAEPGNISNIMYLDQFRMDFVAIRDISVGEELTHDYLWGNYVGARLNPVDKYLRPIPKNRWKKLGINPS